MCSTRRLAWLTQQWPKSPSTATVAVNLVAGPTPEPVEGTWDSSRFVVIEFPDMDRVREWYDCPEYRRARAIREGKVRVGMLFVEGTLPEGFSLPA
ncbi:DUF1330 domain-containing protein [Streptomyces sp. NPDC050355]|uniref:DUF1330 domain-containing protein n=1 Tax=Streptomyces sp. NPDC050355 TaxID=3365609 RepID=UPI0037BD1E7A